MFVLFLQTRSCNLQLMCMSEQQIALRGVNNGLFMKVLITQPKKDTIHKG